MNIRTLIVALLLVGTGVGSSYVSAQMDEEEQSEDRNQCYRREGFDPPGACTGCYNICLGAGYVCCRIVVAE
jgi:hypothetical protein